MDPATIQALLRIAVPLGTSLIQILRTAGRPADADAIEAILRRSDAIAETIIDTARAELAKVDPDRED